MNATYMINEPRHPPTIPNCNIMTSKVVTVSGAFTSTKCCNNSAKLFGAQLISFALHFFNENWTGMGLDFDPHATPGSLSTALSRTLAPWIVLVIMHRQLFPERLMHSMDSDGGAGVGGGGVCWCAVRGTRTESCFNIIRWSRSGDCIVSETLGRGHYVQLNLRKCNTGMTLHGR